MKKILFFTAIMLFFWACAKTENRADAYGNFEVNEVTISSQAAGELLKFSIEEGEKLSQNQIVGLVDTTLLTIKKNQIINNIAGMAAKIESANLNLQAVQQQRKLLEKEKNRVAELFQKNATTEQNRDKIFSDYDVLLLKIAALKKDIQSLEKQKIGMEYNLTEIHENLAHTKIVNPINGVVLVKYKEAHEILGKGTPLYKIGNLKDMILKVYVSADQLDNIQIGQPVEVLFDKDKSSNHKTEGKISWISAQSEFTPKNIQTKEERIDQVYAVKIKVKNDGPIKIGMPGEVNF
jgi:HlyD family secretion protein